MKMLYECVCVCVCVCAFVFGVDRGPQPEKIPPNRGRTCNRGPSSVGVPVLLYPTYHNVGVVWILDESEIRPRFPGLCQQNWYYNRGRSTIAGSSSVRGNFSGCGPRFTPKTNAHTHIHTHAHAHTHTHKRTRPRSTPKTRMCVCVCVCVCVHVFERVCVWRECVCECG